MSNQALAQFNPDWAIEQISNGAFLRDISAQTGIDKRRLSEALRQHPNYQSAKIASITCQLDDAQQSIDSAVDSTDIARAREKFRAAAWRAERECRAIYGQNVDLTSKNEALTAEDVPAIARRMAFLLRKGLDQDDDIEDAHVVSADTVSADTDAKLLINKY